MRATLRGSLQNDMWRIKVGGGGLGKGVGSIKDPFFYETVHKMKKLENFLGHTAFTSSNSTHRVNHLHKQSSVAHCAFLPYLLCSRHPCIVSGREQFINSKDSAVVSLAIPSMSALVIWRMQYPQASSTSSHTGKCLLLQPRFV